jgi:DNA ligase-1
LKGFAALYEAIDRTTRTNEKVEAMVRYFAAAPPADAAWAVSFLSGERPKRLLPARRLAAWAGERTGIAEWLFDECYAAVGDLAETIALLLPPASEKDEGSLDDWVTGALLPLAGAAEATQRAAIEAAWERLEGTSRFLWNKLITGELRVGVAKSLVIRALARYSGVEEAVVAHRLAGAWRPSAEAFTALVAPVDDAAGDDGGVPVSRPYPFFLAYALEGEVEELGEARDWQAEWKWDGIRAQLLRRGAETFVWSRGEELMTERFPELAAAAEWLPDGTVLDGELLPWRGDDAGRPLPFSEMQRRIGRKKLSPRILAEVPIHLVAYDLLEAGGVDLRARPLVERRAALAELLGAGGAPDRFLLSPLAAPTGEAAAWTAVREAFARARERGAEGLMLKRLDAPYGVGRRRGPWWKWKVAPFTVDAVLVYAQPGHGRRASLHTDYTFAVWRGDELVPFAKAYSGLSDAEIRTVDEWIRKHTVERFGPVRAVEPELVFELAFEDIRVSSRHKSGVAVRFPRIVRPRPDKTPADADRLDQLLVWIEQLRSVDTPAEAPDP